MRVLIVGCGYVGVHLGAELVGLGHQVFGLRRSLDGASDLTSLGIQPLVADITQGDDLKKIEPAFDWVVNCVSSTRGGASEYQQVYLEGNRNLIHWLQGSPLQKFVYTSSTSVYGQTDGSSVTEVSPTEPKNETSQILVQTEQLLLDAAAQSHFPAVVLRVAGIYGPGRGHLFLQFLQNEARISGLGDRLINMVHRDDVAGAIIAALEKGTPGEIYNVADDQPLPQLAFFIWLSEMLGKPLPPFAAEAENTGRKRGLTQKRVANLKLKSELGYQFKYPNFQAGYSAEIERLKANGQLPAS